MPVLMAHLFAWIAMPLPVNELVMHLTQMLNVADMRFEALEEERGQETVSMPCKELYADLFTREYLQQFGVFLCKAQTPRSCHRGQSGSSRVKEFNHQPFTHVQVKPPIGMNVPIDQRR